MSNFWGPFFYVFMGKNWKVIQSINAIFLGIRAKTNKAQPRISIIPFEKVKARRSIQLFEVLEKWSSFSEF